MAYKASLKALNNINKEDIGIIIVATMSSPYISFIACLLQERLGLNNNVFAFDLTGHVVDLSMHY